MKFLKSFVLLTGFILIAGVFLQAQTAVKTVYLFYAENCTACKEAHTFYKKPAGLKDGSSWINNGIKFVTYRIVDENNKMNIILLDLIRSL